MESILKNYLEGVTQQLKWLPSAAREAEVREVEDHLRTMIEAQVAQGTAYGDAVGESIRRFGDARKVGRALSRAWHKRQPESVGRAVIAFLVALVGQYLVLCGAIGFAALVGPTSSSDSTPNLSVQLLFCLVGAPLLSGFLTMVVAPRRGQAAAIVAYLAIVVLSLGIVLVPYLGATTHSRGAGASLLFMLSDRIILTINLLVISSIVSVLIGTRLGKVWGLSRALRPQFKNLRPR